MKEQVQRQNRRKILQGVVLSDKMNKTRVVQVPWAMMHDKYHKIMRRSSKYKAHDEKHESKMGDVVRMMETRPMSKEKRWVILSVLKTN